MEDLEERRHSVSRGREAFKSTGRGGAGNIHASPSVEVVDERELSPSRGRELDVEPETTKTSGRGGLGNIRSRSRARAVGQVPEGFPQTASIVSESVATNTAYERRVIEDSEKSNIVHSTGRGGAGNMSGSRSRSRGPQKLFGGDSSPRVHSSGRGGAGNIQPGTSHELDTVDSREEADLYGPFSNEGIHSTGRGGRANMTSAQSPSVEDPIQYSPGYDYSGRGGAGNIRSRSQSRETHSPRSASISRMWQKVTHPHARDIKEESAAVTDGDGGTSKNE